MPRVEVGDYCNFWRRDPGGRSQVIQCEVLETFGENWAFVRRLDTGEERHIDPKRLIVVKLAPLKEENDETLEVDNGAKSSVAEREQAALGGDAELHGPVGSGSEGADGDPTGEDD